ncbi:MAG TPA: tetratricopeptide repeat protein, partial [Desulfobacteraceae bacterium]|nr:tetratricopeptide repeat protein [Desulfobacteraceae bacterium]
MDILLQLSEYYVSRQPEKVILYATQAIKLSRNLNSKVATGRSHIHRAAGFLQSGNLDEAEKDYREGLQIGMEAKHHGLMGAALNGVAAVALNRGDSTNALATFQRAIRHVRQEGDRRRLAGIYNNMSLIHFRSGELRKALDFMLKALRIYEELDHRPGIGVVLNSIGNVYNRLNNPDQAMSHFQNALKIARETDNRQLAVVCRVNIGEIQKDRGHFSEALATFKAAHTDAEKLGSLDYMAVCLNNIGDVFHQQGLQKDALNSYQQSLELFQRMNAKPRMVTSHLNMGNVYLDINKLDLAENHLKLAVRLAVETESHSLHKDAVWSLIRLYETRKDLARALEHYREYTTLQAQLFSRENYAKLSALQAKYESEKRISARKVEESSVRIRQLDRKRRILVILILIAALFLVALVLFILYRRHRLRTRTEMEWREAYARMERIARFDNLTRLYNRHTFMERIDIEMVRMGRTWRPFCLIML